MATKRAKGQERDPNWIDINKWVEEYQKEYDCHIDFVVLPPHRLVSAYYVWYVCTICLPNKGVLEPRKYRAHRQLSASRSDGAVPAWFGCLVEAASMMERDPQSKFWRKEGQPQ